MSAKKKRAGSSAARAAMRERQLAVFQVLTAAGPLGVQELLAHDRLRGVHPNRETLTRDLGRMKGDKLVELTGRALGAKWKVRPGAMLPGTQPMPVVAAIPEDARAAVRDYKRAWDAKRKAEREPLAVHNGSGLLNGEPDFDFVIEGAVTVIARGVRLRFRASPPK